MLYNCVAGLEFTDRFCEWLRAMPLKGTTYFQCFQEVTEGLKQCLASEPNLKPEKVAFLTGFIQAFLAPSLASLSARAGRSRPNLMRIGR